MTYREVFEERDDPPGPHDCEICGRPNARRGLVRWRDPLPGQLYGSIWRCSDIDACRRAVQQAGEAWPVDDRLEELPLPFDPPPQAAEPAEPAIDDESPRAPEGPWG